MARRPISTAPKDGTTIIVWGVGWARPVVSFWRETGSADAFQAVGGGSDLYRKVTVSEGYWDSVQDASPQYWAPLPDMTQE